jgi:hypothetical protein
MDETLMCYNNWPIVERDAKGWGFLERYPLPEGSIQDNTRQAIARYNLSPEQVVNHLFCVANGRMGYYLMDMVSKRAYYCGLLREDMIEKAKTVTQCFSYKPSS